MKKGKGDFLWALYGPQFLTRINGMGLSHPNLTRINVNLQNYTHRINHNLIMRPTIFSKS